MSILNRKSPTVCARVLKTENRKNNDGEKQWQSKQVCVTLVASVLNQASVLNAVVPSRPFRQNFVTVVALASKHPSVLHATAPLPKSPLNYVTLVVSVLKLMIASSVAEWLKATQLNTGATRRCARPPAACALVVSRVGFQRRLSLSVRLPRTAL